MFAGKIAYCYNIVHFTNFQNLYSKLGNGMFWNIAVQKEKVNADMEHNTELQVGTEIRMSYIACDKSSRL